MDRLTKILIAIVVLFGVLIALTLWWRGSGSPETPEDPIGEFPQGGATTAPTKTDELEIMGRDGTVVRIHDIRQDPGVRKDEGASYRLYDFGPSSEDRSFGAVYSDMDQGFLITLSSLPLATARAEAERFLLSRLMISEMEACTLNISVAVPAKIDQTLAGKNLGLSFCFGSASLE